jgi:hypothetical protein
MEIIMFNSTSNFSFEGSPLEILRKYAPYLVAAGAAVSMTVSLYYVAFSGGKDMVDSTSGAVTGIVEESKTATNTIIGNFASNP